MAREIPTEQNILGYFQDYSNWGRWGADDQLGTVNYITPQKRKQGAALVTEGESVTCARMLRREIAPDVPNPTLHFMTGSGERWAGVAPEEGVLQSSGDFLGVSYHGFSVTHLDSLAHIFWDGKMYNNLSADVVNTSEGATKGSIDLIANGIVTRGVLLDIPRLKGVDWLEPGEPIFPEDLEAAEAACGVRVESGDALLVRTGWLRRRNELGPISAAVRPGLQALTLPWLHQRQVAVLGGDGTNDVQPSYYPTVRLPIHQIGIVGMGLWLLDNANLEELAAVCQTYNRWEFMLTVGPLRIENGTGSPVNPIAVF